MRGKIVLLAAIVILSGFAAGLTINVEAPSYEKGGPLVFSGTCEQVTMHRVRGEINEKIIFDEQINCFDSKFTYTRPTTYLDPSGNWKVTLYTSQSEASVIAKVLPTPESSFYRITFLSPAAFSFERASTVLISVEVTDSGEPVEGAQVIMYDTSGERIDLTSKGNGVYDVNYFVRSDSQLGEWDLIVAAQKEQGGNTYGGERKISTELVQSGFTFEIMEPSLKSYEQSDPVPVKARVTYPSGQAVSVDNVEQAELRVAGRAYPLEVNSQNQFVASYRPEQSGNQVLRIYIKDQAGNEGEEAVSIVVTCSLTCFLKSYGLIILVTMLVVGVVARLFYSKISKSMSMIKLTNERKKTLELIQNLQKDYFGKGVMPSSSYKNNLANYKAKLIEIDQRIKELQKKMDEEK